MRAPSCHVLTSCCCGRCCRDSGSGNRRLLSSAPHGSGRSTTSGLAPTPSLRPPPLPRQLPSPWRRDRVSTRFSRNFSSMIMYKIHLWISIFFLFCYYSNIAKIYSKERASGGNPFNPTSSAISRNLFPDLSRHQK